MVKRLRKWSERLTTLVIGDREYQGHVKVYSQKICRPMWGDYWIYAYSFKTGDREIPINSQGQHRVAAINGKLVQKL